MSTKVWLGTTDGSFNTAGNWSGGVAPANSDTLVFDGRSSVSVVSNLSTSLTGITLIKYKSFTGSIGVAPLAATAAAYLTLDGGTLHLEENPNGSSSATGSPLLMVKNSGSTAMTINVYDSASSTGSYPPILITGGTAIQVNQFGGSIGVSQYASETATITHNVSKGTSTISPQWSYGSGVTVTALTSNVGTGVSSSDQTATAVTLSGSATFRTIGTGAHTTVTIGSGATCFYYCNGTITTLNVQGEFNRVGDARALTLTTTNIYKGAKMFLDNGKPSSTTRTTINVINCGAQDFTVSTPLGERF